jgi:hypothetical protein
MATSQMPEKYLPKPYMKLYVLLGVDVDGDRQGKLLMLCAGFFAQPASALKDAP